MAIYIDPDVVQDIDNINSSVFRYLIKKHKEYCRKLQKNYDYYWENIRYYLRTWKIQKR